MAAITGLTLSSALLIGGGIAAAGAGAGIGISALMNSGKGSTPQMQMPQAPAAPKLEDASQAAQMRADERKRAMARSKSITTNPLGTKGEAETVRKTLLGG